MRYFFYGVVVIGSLALASCGELLESDPGYIEAGGDCQGGVIAHNIYYVSAAGEDSATGLTREAAFGTLAKAIGVACPGDTLLISPGSYFEGISVFRLGGSQALITIQGDGDGVVFDGQMNVPIGFWCEHCVGISVNNIAFQNYTDIGIGFLQSNDIYLSNLSVHDNGFAVSMTDLEFEGYGIQIDDSSGVVVENNDVHHNGPNQQISMNPILGTGINVYGCLDCAIRGNWSHNNIGGGILVEDSINVLVEENTVTENDLDASTDGWWDGGLWVDGGHNIIIRNNVFADNLGPGIEISNEDNQEPFGYVLENNVSRGNYFGIYLWKFGVPGFPEEEILQMSGNQFVGNTRQDVWISAWECPPDDPCD